MKIKLFLKEEALTLTIEMSNTYLWAGRIYGGIYYGVQGISGGVLWQGFGENRFKRFECSIPTMFHCSRTEWQTLAGPMICSHHSRGVGFRTNASSFFEEWVIERMWPFFFTIHAVLVTQTMLVALMEHTQTVNSCRERHNIIPTILVSITFVSRRDEGPHVKKPKIIHLLVDLTRLDQCLLHPLTIAAQPTCLSHMFRREESRHNLILPPVLSLSTPF